MNNMLLTLFFSMYALNFLSSTRIQVRRNNEYNWDNWNIAPDNEGWWGFEKLLGTREVEQKIKEQATTTVKYDDVMTEPGFPWQGLGVPDTGAKPPSQSKVKNYVGQSPGCLLRPSKGNGGEWYLRWYFDTYTGTCNKFVYSGKGGNINKFLTEYHCNQSCVLPPRPCCVPDQLFDYAKYIEMTS